jgi:hypothetical protein
MSAVLPNLEKMTREQMLQAMEELWEALSKDEDAIATPEWHKTTLEETEARYRSGAEVPIPWEKARQELLSSRQRK